MIAVRSLTKRFGNLEAVRDISFRVESGETFALLGPNGSGKTTTLKCIVGLMAPTSGQIGIGGIVGWKNRREAGRLFSYLPQRVAFHENLTAREVLAFYCRLRRLPSVRAERVLETAGFHLDGLADRPVSEFSGGMIQRLGIAVATLPDAPILILDEPTISLDPEGTIRFREFISGLKREGKSILFSSHVLFDVERLADRVAILIGGKLIAVESVGALRNGQANGSRLRLLLLNPDERYVRIARDAGASEATLQKDTLILSSRAEDRRSILRAVEDAGAVIGRFSTEEPSLEEIYWRHIHESTASLPARSGGLPDSSPTAG